MTIREEFGNAGAYEALAPTSATSITTSIRLPTSGLYTGIQAKIALITVESYPMRFRIDGTAPTSTTGHKVDPGQSCVIIGAENVKNFSCIDTADGASAVLVTCFF